MTDVLARSAPASAGGASRPLPRLGFLGVGWIGRQRLEAIAASGYATIAAVADPAADAAHAIACAMPGCVAREELDALLALDLDGIVIATPSALHAGQAVAALERGLAVFCQKPLGRNAAETRQVIDAARAANLLLGVDLSYRFTAAATRLKQLVSSGALGGVHAADLVFHNAYGPDRPWFRDARLSGGGCVIDLGIHLVDLALWLLDFPRVEHVTARLYASGTPFSALGARPSSAERVEDYAEARLDLSTGATLRLACSWNLPAGRDAVIGAHLYGTRGGAALRNVHGSFLDFVAERYDGTRCEVLTEPPDAWGGRAAVDWARRLAAGERFDPAVERLGDVAAALDAIYAAG